MNQRDRIIDAIATMTAENGHAPTIRELGEAVGLKSPDSVSFHLTKLRVEGRVTWIDGKSRTLRVLAVAS